VGRQRLAGIALTGLGLAVAITGVVGWALDRGSSSTAATTALSSPSATPAATPTATPSPQETPQQFLDMLAQAMRTGDVAFMLNRLHPVVIARFGSDVCRTAVAKLTDPTAAFNVKRVDAPAPYDYRTDTRSTTVAETTAVTVDRTRQGQTAQLTVHVTLVDARFRWFTDCGLA
jgi:hypothetical protein